MANPDQNSTEAAMNAYMRQVEQFKEYGGERSNRELERLRNQSGLPEWRAKLVEDQVFTGEWREAERLRGGTEFYRYTRNNSDGGNADPNGDGDSDAEDSF